MQLFGYLEFRLTHITSPKASGRHHAVEGQLPLSYASVFLQIYVSNSQIYSDHLQEFTAYLCFSYLKRLLPSKRQTISCVEEPSNRTPAVNLS